MTSITTRPVVRETSARDRGRPIIIELGAHELVFREKGRRTRISLPILAAYHAAWKAEARRERAAKLEQRKRKW